MRLRHAIAILAGLPLAASLQAQRPHLTLTTTSALESAPISNVRYGVTVDTADVRNRILKVTMSFDASGTGPVILSLPAWTPGAYEISNFARNVGAFSPTANGKPVEWDKVDYDTWRIQPGGARSITVSFDFLADSLDNAMAWTRPDFAFFNGTNLFLYPEGLSLDFPATVSVGVPEGWRIVTSMHPAGAAHTWHENTYHDLVDMPFFVGHMDLDSTQINGKWTRFASYPAGALSGTNRDSLERRVSRIIPAEASVLGETPWDSYSVLLVFDSSYGGSASALEHQASHLGVYGTVYLGPGNDTIVTSVTAHEIFHAWNVKRLRPSEMVPYRYSAPEPTPWLWVSEGITDYYSDVALARAGVYDSAAFINKMMGNIQQVTNTAPTALEDASLSTWIHPRDGSGYLYYPKGSLAGFMLDIMIRDASDNQRSLDDVMKNLYQSTYKHGQGFTGDEWWSAVRQAAGGKAFNDFAARYVNGRDPYPWASLLPQAGLRWAVDTAHLARVGINSRTDSTGEHILGVTPGGAAEQAGVQAGDQLISVGGFSASDPNWAVAFRQKFNSQPGAPYQIVVRRGGQDVTLNAKVIVMPVVNASIAFDPHASPRAVRIRNGIMHGR